MAKDVKYIDHSPQIEAAIDKYDAPFLVHRSTQRDL